MRTVHKVINIIFDLPLYVMYFLCGMYMALFNGREWLDKAMKDPVTAAVDACEKYDNHFHRANHIFWGLLIAFVVYRKFM